MKNGISVNYANVLQYLELAEIPDLKMQPINFGNIQKSAYAPQTINNEITEELPMGIDFTMYPNPAQTEVHIIYDINDFARGTYLVSVVNDEQVITKKLIVN